jgi:hypothetical protein
MPHFPYLSYFSLGQAHPVRHRKEYKKNQTAQVPESTKNKPGDQAIGILFIGKLSIGKLFPTIMMSQLSQFSTQATAHMWLLPFPFKVVHNLKNYQWFGPREDSPQLALQGT